MKTLLLIINFLVFFFFETFPQERDTTLSVFSMDFIATDSFYLVRVDTVYRIGKVRPEVVYQSELFRDTLQLNELIREKQRYLQQLQLQAKAIQTKIAEINNYIEKVVCLRDSVIFQLSCSSGQRTVHPPSAQEVKRYEEFEPQPRPQRSRHRQKMRRGKM